MNKYLVIYLNKERTSTHVIRPTIKFNGDWQGLADTITLGNYVSYQVVES